MQNETRNGRCERGIANSYDESREFRRASAERIFYLNEGVEAILYNMETKPYLSAMDKGLASGAWRGAMESKTTKL